jgi:hypothetical protein
MATGLEIMLKAMGIDPQKMTAELMDRIGVNVKEIGPKIAEFTALVRGIDKKLDVIMLHLGIEPDESFAEITPEKSQPDLYLIEGDSKIVRTS